MIARTPASNACSRAVGEGEEGVRGHHRPVERRCPRRAALSTAMRTESTRLICPAPMPDGAEALATARSRWSARACRPSRRTAARPTPPRWACARVTACISSRASSPTSRSCTSRPPRTRLMSCSVDLRAPALGVLEEPHVGLAAAGSRARPRRSRARTPAPRTSRCSFSASAAVDRPVEAHDAAEGALAVGGQRLLEGLRRRCAPTAHAARVVVLDDRGRRQLELLDQPAARVQVEQVVERQLLAVQLGDHRQQVRARARPRRSRRRAGAGSRRRRGRAPSRTSACH